MAKFVKLEQLNGQAIWVNPEQVSKVLNAPGGPGETLIYTSDGYTVNGAKGDAEYIIRLLQ